MMSAMLALALFLIVGAVTPAPPSIATADTTSALRDQMIAARAQLVRNFAQINTRSGIAVDLETRIDSDSAGIEPSARPTWMSDADFADYNAYLVKLDATLIDQLATANYHALGAIRGADDTLYRTPADGTMQPLGVYVPPSYDPKKPAPLVVLLHGRGDSESDMIASPWVRANADAAGCIVIAPYARGDSQYVDPASQDVYAALDAARTAFNVDPHRIYLVGHSMGGYGVFIVGPKHPEVWAGVLAASGGMVTEDTATALKAFQNIPVYLVVGSNDPIVPHGYMKQNYDLLQSSNIEAYYYEEPGGLHPIGTIKNAFARAWHDLLARSTYGSAMAPPTPHPTPPPQKP
jgi:predicted esterase